MFKNYFRTAWRNIRKNKVFSAINIAGLAIGMAACIMIMLFVKYEKGFDAIHTKNIYRLDEVQKFEGMVAPQNVALSMYPMGPTLKNDFPEILNFTRFRANDKVAVEYSGKKIYIPKLAYVDSTFLQIFDFKLLEGNRSTALETKNSALLTRESAKKIFGVDNPVGKTFQRFGGDTVTLTVTGIIDKIPANSHLQFDALVTFSTIAGPRNMENWGGNWLNTYLELAPNTNIKSLESKFPAYLKKYMARNDNWKFYELFLQPLSEVHSGSTNITHDYNNFQKFDKRYTYIFSVIALVILVIACINFMNLSTARSAERAKEVGIRKTIGAERLQLSLQFIGESVLLALISLVLAIGLAYLFLPAVNNLSQRTLEIPFLTDPSFLITILAGTVLAGVISGLYPAAYLSSFQPIKVLKSSIQGGNNKTTLRNILVVGQFTGAIFLIIATVFAVKQLRFMQQKDPGFTKDQVAVIPLDRNANGHYSELKKELQNNSLISGVTASQQRLGNNLHQTGVTFHGPGGPARDLTSSQVVVDPDYLEIYKIPIIAGRNFSNDYAADNAKTYIINETLAKELLKDNPKAEYDVLLGRNFGFGGMDSTGTIIGVAKDFNFNSLHHKIETLCIFNQSDWGFGEMSVKINGQKAQESIAAIEKTWKSLIKETPFEYKFLDDHFEELYRADSQVSRVVAALAVLAIIISCLGLFGLASYAAERKIKEIGIRKVLGASVNQLVMMLSSHFLKLVIISNLIAIPLAWWAISKWLEDFAYRIPITWVVFALAGLAALLIAIITVSFQAIKAALTNPVKTLRTE
ncbi:ABC transporter permease [Pollutibacter soli]|uniref:ABC transporter permease n=1 Tax=Pollutibacter soli TaxID=3034157 RepID=UPI0030140929